jgi:regulator of sigma E protease
VDEFSIGMGPRLAHFHKGETDYSLRALPIGGFCVMPGEDSQDEDGTPCTDPHAFCNKPKWQRFLVLVMGGVMNIILGLVLMSILLGQETAFASTTISQFSPHSALQSAGMQAGDRFTSINGYKIHTDKDLIFALALANPDSVTVQAVRKGKAVSFNNIKLHATASSGGKKIVQLDFYVKPVSKTPLTIFQKTFTDTISVVRQVWASLAGLVTGRFGLNDMTGPVGLVQVISQSASAGLQKSFLSAVNNILYIIMIITVNLGIINLLPVPALDGGKILFLIIEAVRRKPLNPKYAAVIESVFFSLLLAFMVIVSVSDVMRITTGHGIGG